MVCARHRVVCRCLFWCVSLWSDGYIPWQPGRLCPTVAVDIPACVIEHISIPVTPALQRSCNSSNVLHAARQEDGLQHQVRVCARHFCAAHAPDQHDGQADGAHLAGLRGAAQALGGQGAGLRPPAAGTAAHAWTGCMRAACLPGRSMRRCASAGAGRMPGMAFCHVLHLLQKAALLMHGPWSCG